MMEGRAKADLPKLRAMPLFNDGQHSSHELDEAQAERESNETNLLSMFADEGKAKTKGREESVVC